MLELNPKKTPFSKCSNTCNSTPNAEASADTWACGSKTKPTTWATDQTVSNQHKWVGAQNSGTACYQSNGPSNSSTTTPTWSTNPSNPFSTTSTCYPAPFQATAGKPSKASPSRSTNATSKACNKLKGTRTTMTTLTRTRSMRRWWNGTWRLPCRTMTTLICRLKIPTCTWLRTELCVYAFIRWGMIFTTCPMRSPMSTQSPPWLDCSANVAAGSTAAGSPSTTSATTAPKSSPGSSTSNSCTTASSKNWPGSPSPSSTYRWTWHWPPPSENTCHPCYKDFSWPKTTTNSPTTKSGYSMSRTSQTHYPT